MCVCVSACAYASVHTLWKTHLNKNLWRHYTVCSVFLFPSLVFFFYYFSCHWSLIFQRLKLYFFTLFLLKQWHTANNILKYAHTHAKHKELEDKRENMAHICAVLCCSDINKQVLYAKNRKKLTMIAHMFRKHWIQGNVDRVSWHFVSYRINIAEDALLFVYFLTTASHTESKTFHFNFAITTFNIVHPDYLDGINERKSFRRNTSTYNTLTQQSEKIKL